VRGIKRFAIAAKSGRRFLFVVTSFSTEESFLTHATNSGSAQVLAGVIFDGDFRSSFPNNVTITLRFRPDPVNVRPGEGSAFTGM